MYLRCLSLALVLAAAPLAAKELRVCAEPDNLPYSRTDESGFENRIARLLAQDLNATLVYAWLPQRRAFVRRSEGRCEVFIGVPSDFERLMTTKPYYRSSYVFVWKKTPLRSFDEPHLRDLRIGVQLPGNDLAATPPGHALALRGATDNVVGYTIYGERPAAERIVAAIARGELDAAVIWGPQAGYFADGLQLAAAQAPAELASLPFAFSISVGVRRGHRALRDEIDAALERRRRDIDAVLGEYRVPRL